MFHRNPSGRRGVILLIVLTLLVLFSLIGITFLVVASRYRASAVQFARAQQTGDAPAKLLEKALGQLMYGPRTNRSALWGHDLLSDLYGNDGAFATITAAAPEAAVGQQFLQLALAPLGGYALPDCYGYYNGCVLTVLDGNARGYSTRIVGYQFSGGTATVRVEALESDYPQTVLPANGNRVWINGHAFNGSGAGFDYSAGATATRMTDGSGRPIALLPHYGRLTGIANVAPGGADESYDAADFQNMFLALVNHAGGNLPPVLPSFHRPDLCAYWAANDASAWSSDNNFIRSVVLRPLPSDHPNFSGSNPAMTAAVDWRANLANLNGRWDVDNDGDGRPDSVWVDLGFPAVAGKDGRMYKPLFAFLVQDLDGRADINAWGNLKQFAYTAPPTYPFYAGNTGGAPINVRRGQGFGPAEINWQHLVSGSGAYQTLLQRRYNPNEGSPPAPGLPGGGGDIAAFLHKLGWPRAGAALGTGGFGAYGAPFDIVGQGAIGVDALGHPVQQYSFTAADVNDVHYELNLNRRPGTSASSVDQPFTLAELERLLRRNDPDARGLPGGLFSLDSGAFNTARTAAAVTTSSRHIPAPSHLIRGAKFGGNVNPGLLFRGTYASTSVVDLVAARLRASGVSEPELTRQLKLLLPWEILKGGRMDINRWLGNGPDGSANANVVWDFTAHGVAPAPAAHNGAPPNFTNNDPAAPGSLNQQQAQRFAKQIYARHLYVLMRLLMDDSFQLPTASAAGGSVAELTSQRIAQWAVNVVDFADPDSIMTGFEYDLDPFDSNGWAVDGDLATTNDPAGANRRVVFGVEYPDLVLSEAIAFHDKRLKDTAIDGTMKKRKKPDQEAEDDDDLDQFRIPQGSLFLELYCARGQQINNPLLPPELYDNNGRLMLDALAPASPNVGNLQFPVWRVAISQFHAAGDSVKTKSQTNPDQISFQPGDLNSLVTPVTGSPDPLPIERYVWFTPTAPQPGHLEGSDFTQKDIFYNRGASPRIAPAQYAVVGPRPTTYFGVRKSSDPTMPDPLSVQRIDLAAASVQTTALDGTAQTRNAVGIVCAAQAPAGWTEAGTTAPQGVGLNVTEPLPQSANYYQEPTTQLPGYPTKDAYDDPQAPMNSVPDRPADYEPGRPIEDNAMQQTGTYFDRRTAFVQRLADPTQPYDPLGNPYITLDWLPIDVTVFNGEDREPAGFFSPGNFDPSDTEPYGAGSGTPEHFATRERGETGQFNLWTPTSINPVATNQSADTDPQPHNFRLDLMASVNPRRETLGGLNAKYGTPGSYGAPYDQAPAQPFPWIPIANRPFVSPYELLLVPSSTQARLMFEFTLPTAGMDPYGGSNVAHFRAPYGYLLNFLHTSTSNGSTAANFHRLFDFVEVPSRFDGTSRYYDANTFAGAAAGSGADFFRPPYNRLSRFRDPGLVNINTIVDGNIWSNGAYGGVVGEPNHPWGTIETSRQGGSVPTMPSLFGNPFRAAGAADLVPLDSMKQAEIDVTLLRREPPGPGNQPLLADTTVQAYNSIQRHPYFRYQTLISLGNKVKTTSNVFAVWITVGYFEVTATAPTVGIPDGWQLGQELGSDTGEIRRQRAFYILDRSIPVAAQPGEAHNTERMVLLRRYID